MRTLELVPGASPRAWGQAHGESFRGEIRSITDIRIYLTIQLGGGGGKFTSTDDVLEVAEAHLPVLARYDQALYDELVGIAEGAGVSPAHIVVLNHYTDLRDIDPAWLRAARPASGQGGRDSADEPGDGCSILWARTPEGPILAQTWDMHATAIPYIMMLHVPGHDVAGTRRPESWLLSITGCLGMAGLSRAGVGVAINNLNSVDAQLGVVWPALVRRALAEPTAAAACDRILGSPIGSGHHYMTADRDTAFGIETSGMRRKVMFTAAPAGQPGSPHQGPNGAYVHTNHCLDPDIAEVSRVPASSTTHERYGWLCQSLAGRPLTGMRDAWARLGSDEGYPRSVCGNMATPENPHGTATCGAIAMELGAARGVWAQAGLIHNVAPERFDFAEAFA